MNKKRIIIAAIILVGLIGGSYVWLILPLDWEQISKKISPEGNITAFHMRSKSEAGAAPYGDHIVLVPRYKIFGQYYSAAIFAGYCGQDFDYQWLDRNSIQITCTGEKIMKQETSSNGISIKYRILTKATHNNRLKPDTRKTRAS